MKKMRNLLIALVAVVVLALGAAGLSACGGSSAAIENVYTGHEFVLETKTVEYNGVERESTSGYSLVVNIELYDDNSYVLHINYQQLSQGSSGLGATFVTNAVVYGTSYTLGEVQSGYRKLEIKQDSWTHAFVSQDVMSGMFVLNYDSEEVKANGTTLVGRDDTTITFEKWVDAFSKEAGEGENAMLPEHFGNFLGDHTYYVIEGTGNTQQTHLVFAEPQE
jgi:hypothetical protein